MSEPPAPHIAKLFKRGDPNNPGIVGSPEFISSLPRRARPYRCKMSLDDIIANVANLRGLDQDVILSKSRVRECVLARAMIAWYAVERGVANLNQVAVYLRRDPSTLSVAVTRYRTLRPDLFTLTMFQPLVPIAQWSPAAMPKPVASRAELGAD
jgi:hypothetical protein